MVHYNTAEKLYSQAPQSILEHVPHHLQFVDPLPAEMVAPDKGYKPISSNRGDTDVFSFCIVISQHV